MSRADAWELVQGVSCDASTAVAARIARTGMTVWTVVFTGHTGGGVLGALTIGGGASRRWWLLFEASPVLVVLVVAGMIWRRRWRRSGLSRRRAWWSAVVWCVVPPLIDYVVWEPVAGALYWSLMG